MISAALKNSAFKNYKNVLSAGHPAVCKASTSAATVLPVTTINKNLPAVGTGQSIPSSLTPKLADDGFVRTVRKGRAQLPDSLPNPAKNPSEKSMSSVIGVRSSLTSLL